jgi:hypothetical protein
MRTHTCFVSAFAILAAAGTARAGVLQFDLNSLASQARGPGGANAPFGGVNHTGSVHLSATSNSTLAEILIDGAAQNIAPGQLQSFSGIINLVNGGVVGGNLSFTLTGGEVFSALIQNGVGQVNTQAGQGFRIDGLLRNITLSSDPFGGVGVTPFFDAQPLEGAFLNFSFAPDANGFDGVTSLDIFVVPSPAAGAMLVLGGAFASRRRRG